jgi:uncharacterized protein YigA (DUF484 family)
MSDIVERLRLDAEPTEGDMETAAQEIEKLRAENERLTNNARSDARLLAAYHKWCDMQGCAPSSSDLSKARAALGEKE